MTSLTEPTLIIDETMVRMKADLKDSLKGFIGQGLNERVKEAIRKKTLESLMKYSDQFFPELKVLYDLITVEVEPDPHGDPTKMVAVIKGPKTILVPFFASLEGQCLH
jgi:hypothetical protein